MQRELLLVDLVNASGQILPNVAIDDIAASEGGEMSFFVRAAPSDLDFFYELKEGALLWLIPDGGLRQWLGIDFYGDSTPLVPLYVSPSPSYSPSSGNSYQYKLSTMWSSFVSSVPHDFSGESEICRACGMPKVRLTWGIMSKGLACYAPPSARSADQDAPDTNQKAYADVVDDEIDKKGCGEPPRTTASYIRELVEADPESASDVLGVALETLLRRETGASSVNVEVYGVHHRGAGPLPETEGLLRAMPHCMNGQPK